MQSIRRIKQRKGFAKSIRSGKIVVYLRFDDSCGNGHNTFTITGEIVDSKGRFECGGCIHEDIQKYFPEYAHMIPYHLCSTDGPMHYIANTIYHASEISKHQGKYFFYLEDKLIKIVNEDEAAQMRIKYGDNCKFSEYFNTMAKEPDLKAARSSAIWPDASLEQLQSKEQLMARLPSLIETFRNEIIKLGFEW